MIQKSRRKSLSNSPNCLANKLNLTSTQLSTLAGETKIDGLGLLFLKKKCQLIYKELIKNGVEGSINFKTHWSIHRQSRWNCLPATRWKWRERCSQRIGSWG